MKWVIYTVTLFLMMKMVYVRFGDYTSIHWALVYYITLYSMIIALLFYVRRLTVGISRAFFTVVIVYFSVLTLTHVICIFDTALYHKLVSGVSMWSSGASVVLLIGMGFIKIISLKKRKHDRRKIKTGGR